MDGGQRLTIHADGDHRVAAVPDDLHRRADLEPVDGRAEQLVGTGPNTDPVEQVGPAHTLPAGTADIAPADPVSDTAAPPSPVSNIAKQFPASYSSHLDTPSGGGRRLVGNASTDTFIHDVGALGGNIKSVTFTFPARSRIWAAGDISNPVLSLQNQTTPYPIEASARIGSTSIAVKGLLTRPTELAALDMQLKLSGVSLAQLYRVTGIVLPEETP